MFYEYSIVRPLLSSVTPDSSTRAFWQITAETPSNEAGSILARNVRYFCRRSIFVVLLTLYSLTCRKVLRRGADGFTSPPREFVLPILSPLKFQLPRPGLNARTLGPVASMIIARPPRTTKCGIWPININYYILNFSLLTRKISWP
jgi:hypothetical protein